MKKRKAGLDAAGDTDSSLLCLVICFCLFVKHAVGLWGYSGRRMPPLFGDFEAQRHWMELTVNLPMREWYFFDLAYWGLDYPPLTAFVSYLFGRLAQVVYPPLVVLNASRGIETGEGKLFMRLSVLLSDALILLPSIIINSNRLSSTSLPSSPPSLKIDTSLYSSLFPKEVSSAILLVITFLTPSLLLIDHGHFQYNGVAIGLSLLAAYAIQRERNVLGSVLFCLALNFKQTSLYYAPVFFFTLLHKCYRQKTTRRAVALFATLGLTVLGSFTILWAPFCLPSSSFSYSPSSSSCFSVLQQIVHRIFPFHRGLFEDKVSNLWYLASVLLRLKERGGNTSLRSLLLTLLLLLPLNYRLLSRPLRSLREWQLALTCSALVFFLAAYQVHEKALLFTLLPAALSLLPYPDERYVGVWLQLLGSFSMYPLLKRDGLAIPYFTVNALFVALLLLLQEIEGYELMVKGKEQEDLPREEEKKNEVPHRFSWHELLLRHFMMLSLAGMALLHTCEALVIPPTQFPDLFPALFSLYGAINLSAALVVLYVRLLAPKQ